jgi:hypothetical protein
MSLPSQSLVPLGTLSTIWSFFSFPMLSFSRCVPVGGWYRRGAAGKWEDVRGGVTVDRRE